MRNAQHDQISALQTPLRRDDVNEFVMDGEAVILDKRTNAMHLLNATAHLVWKNCDGETPTRHVAKELSNAFGVDQHTADTHVANVFQQLQDSDLLAKETSE